MSYQIRLVCWQKKTKQTRNYLSGRPTCTHLITQAIPFRRPWRNFWAGGSRLPYVSGKTGWPSTRSHSRTPTPALQTHSRTPDISVLGGSSCRRKVSRKIENVRGRRTECSSSAKSRCRSRMRKNQTTSWYRNYFNFDECLLSA